MGFPLFLVSALASFCPCAGRSGGRRHSVVQRSSILWIAMEQLGTYAPSTCGSFCLCGGQYRPRRNAAIYIRSPTGAKDGGPEGPYQPGRMSSFSDEHIFSIRSLSKTSHESCTQIVLYVGCVLGRRWPWEWSVKPWTSQSSMAIANQDGWNPWPLQTKTTTESRRTLPPMYCGIKRDHQC